MCSHRLTCRFEPPEQSWLGVTIEGPSSGVSFSGSSTPLDSVNELVAVLLRVLQFGAGGEVGWNEEPDTVLMVFTGRGDGIRLRVDRISRDGHTTLLEHDDTAHPVVAAFLSGLKQLEAECAEDEYEAGRRHPFPRDAVAQLNRLLNP